MEKKVDCPTCNGKGEAMFSCCSGEVVDSDLGLCPDCKEHLGDDTCEDCEGSGKVYASKEDFTDKAPDLILQAEYNQD